MQNQTQVLSYYSLATHPHYFGAYLNTARGNFFRTMDYISEILQLKKFTEDVLENAAIFKVLQSGAPADIAAKAAKLIDMHFPFIRLLLEAQQNRTTEMVYTSADTYVMLQKFCNLLNQYRNFFTHANHHPVVLAQDEFNKLMYNLHDIYDASLRKIQTQKNYTKEDVLHLTRKAPTDEIRNNKKVYAEPINFTYRFEGENCQLSEKGLAFFICLFLDRRQGSNFLKKLTHFKRGDTPSTRATFDAFTICHIRAPQIKISSTQTGSGLLLNILEETKRCPIDLYELFSISDKIIFDTTPNQSVEIFDKEDEDLYTNKQIRYNGRFAHLALQCIDELNILPNIGLHIDLGNYYFAVKDKQVAGENRKRRLTKHLLGFGKLADFDSINRPDSFVKLARKTHDLPQDHNEIYIADTYPHYHVNGNNIGLRFTPTSAEWPTIGPKSKNPLPNMYISTYELPSLLFYHFLLQHYKVNSTNSVQKIISDYRKKTNTFFEEISLIKNEDFSKPEIISSIFDKHKIAEKNIPVRLNKFLHKGNFKSYNEHCESKLRQMWERTKKRIASIEVMMERAKEKQGKSFYKPIKAGVLADYLAKDIVLLQPTITNSIKGKPTGLLFQVMQKQLAYFSLYKTELTQTFTECNFIGDTNPHPFLKDIPINSGSHLLNFYKTYLQKRQSFIEKCIREKKFAEYHFLHLGDRFSKNDVTYFKELCKKYFDSIPMSLPRNLFKDAIVSTIMQNGNEELKNNISSLTVVNSAYLIKLFFKYELNDSSQDFYEYKRSYEQLNKILYIRNTSNQFVATPSKYFNVDDLHKKVKLYIKTLPVLRPNIKDSPDQAKLRSKLNVILENEKQLRYNINCDSALVLMAKLLIKINAATLSLSPQEEIKLNELTPTAKTGILQKQIPYKVPIHYSPDKPYEISYNQNVEPKEKYITEKLKLKNFGKVRGLVRDSRINNLMYYLTPDEIDSSLLVHELSIFEKRRFEAFEIFHSFEKIICSKAEEQNLVEEEHKQLKYISHDLILKYAETTHPQLTPYLGLMKIVRDNLAHNKYPFKSAFDHFLNKPGIDNALITISDNDWNLIAQTGKEEFAISSQIFKFVEATYGTIN